MGINRANLSLERASLNESTLFFALRDFVVISLVERFKMLLATDISNSFCQAP